MPVQVTKTKYDVNWTRNAIKLLNEKGITDTHIERSTGITRTILHRIKNGVTKEVRSFTPARLMEAYPEDLATDNLEILLQENLKALEKSNTLTEHIKKLLPGKSSGK